MSGHVQALFFCSTRSVLNMTATPRVHTLRTLAHKHSAPCCGTWPCWWPPPRPSPCSIRCARVPVPWQWGQVPPAPSHWLHASPPPCVAHAVVVAAHAGASHSGAGAGAHAGVGAASRTQLAGLADLVVSGAASLTGLVVPRRSARTQASCQ